MSEQNLNSTIRMSLSFGGDLFGIQMPASLGSCPESLVARGQARLLGVAGSNPPGSVSTSLSDSSVSVSFIHA